MSSSEVTRIAEQGGAKVSAKNARQPRQSHQPRPLVAVVLVMVVAACVFILVYTFGGQLSKLSRAITYPVIVGLSFFVFVGLAGLVGLLTGFVHLGRKRQHREFFDALVNSLNEACAVTDERGRVVYHNDDFIDLLEKSGQSRLVGFENIYAGYPDLADKIYRLSQSARGGEEATEEFRLAKGSSAAGANGDGPTWVRISVKPVVRTGGKDNERSFALWRYRDISETRVGQETAFTHLQYIINYLDHAPAGFFSTRENGEIAYLNATLSDWLGMELPEVADGKLKLTDFVEAGDAKMILGMKLDKDNAHTAVFNIDLRTVKGDVLPVRIIHRTDYDSAGVAQPSRSLVLDMRQSSQTGVGSQADVKFARLINSAPFGIAEISAEGKILNSNSAFATLGEGGMQGQLFCELVNENSRPALAEAITKMVGEKKDQLAVNVSFGGEDVEEENTANVLLVRLDRESEQPSSIYAFIIDTSKHSALEEQLAQSQKMQAVGQLAGGVAHDFNNVLTAIIGFSDLLLVSHRPTDPAFADIMNIKQNANRAANLVRQLLAFSRRQTLRPETIYLGDVMSDLGNLLTRLLGETIRLDVVYGRDLGLVKVDLNQFEQVIINLAVNARDAMELKGELTIRTSNISPQESKLVAPKIMPEGEYVLVEVEDNGSGMPPDVVAKIYEPFFSTKEVGKGTGLGLSTVYGIVKQTGGFIFCDSEVGRGTTFKVYLPRVYRQESEEVEEVVKIDVKKADMTGDATILLVEDEDAVRMFASRALSARGYKILEADSGESALEVMENHDGEIHLVLSDVVMPEMDGPTLLKELRNRGITTRFIFISGYAEEAFEKNLKDQEDFAFLAKPFSLKQLTEAVKDALRY